MTSHQLAAMLLQLPDHRVVISDEGDYNTIRDAEVSRDADEQVIRLLRIAPPP